MDEFLIPNANLNRLVDEYNKYGSLTIGFDFDGTVNDFHKKGWKYYHVIDLLRDLKSINCKLICWTAYGDLEYVRKYLEGAMIPFDGINEGGISLGYETKKPFFSALLDDRAGLLQVYTELSILVKIIKIKKQTNV